MHLTNSRHHHLDALRAFAMLLGIILHASLSYVTFPFWPTHDAANNVCFDIIFTIIHGFRMHLFFMISGFFTAMLWRRKGLSSLVKHRSRRIVIPLIIFMVSIIPLTNYILSKTTKEVTKASGTTDIWSASKTNDIEFLETHLQNNKTINEMDPAAGLPPLNWGALNGSTEAVKLILNHGANIEVVSKDKSTPLHHAVFTGRIDIVEILLKKGANPNPVNNYNSTPLDTIDAPWEIVQYVKGSLKLDLHKDILLKNKSKIRALLKQHGALAYRQLTSLNQTNSSEALSETNSIDNYIKNLSNNPLFSTSVFHHLWFLWFLILLLICFIPYSIIVKSFQWKRASILISSPPVCLLWLIPLTMIPQWFNGLTVPSLGPDTSTGILPMPQVFGLYSVFFFFGAIYFDSGQIHKRNKKYSWVYIVVAMLLIFPLGLNLITDPTITLTAFTKRTLSVFCVTAFAWLMTFGLLGMFEKILDSKNTKVRFVSDASYWLYVSHLPLVFWLQYLLLNVEISAFFKFIIVCVFTVTPLLIIYRFIIQKSWLGRMMNKGSSIKAPSKPLSLSDH